MAEFTPPAVDEIEQEQPKFTPPAPDELDLSQVGTSPYERYKLAVARGATPESYSEIAGLPPSQNPDWDIVQQGGYAGLPLSIMGKVAGKVGEVAGDVAVKVADIPTRISNIGKTPDSPGYVPTLEERTSGGRNIIEFPDAPSMKGQGTIPEIAEGITDLAAHTANSLLGRPQSALTLPLMGGEGALGKLAALTFGASVAAGVPDEVANAFRVANDPNATTAQKVEAAGNPLVQAYLAKTMLQHAALPTKGVPDASKIQEATEVHGNVRPLQESPSKVPQPEGGAGVQSPAQAPKAKVPLSDEHAKLLAEHMTEDGHTFGKLREGAVMLADHDTGQVIVDPEQFSKWVDNDLKWLSPEKKAEAVRSAFEHEDIHLKTDPDDAEPFWNSLSPFEQYVLKRQYLKGHDPSRFTPTQLGFEAIRNRMERAMGMTRSDFIGLALHERWTAQALDHLAHIVGKIRSLRDSELSAHQKAILDKVRDNINAARDAITAGAGAGAANQPFALRKEDEPAEGMVRLYRGHDGGEGGAYWTKDKTYASRMGPKMESVDVPADQVSDYAVRKVEGSGTPNAFKLPPELTKGSKPVETQVPVHNLDVGADELLQRKPGDVTVDELLSLPDDEVKKLFEGNQKRGVALQYDSVLAGMKLLPNDAEALKKTRDQLHKDGMKKLQEGLAVGKTDMPAEFGKVIWLNGAIEGALRKGPNYESVTTARRGGPAALRKLSYQEWTDQLEGADRARAIFMGTGHPQDAVRAERLRGRIEDMLRQYPDYRKIRGSAGVAGYPSGPESFTAPDTSKIGPTTGPNALRKKGKAGEQEELFGAPITRRGIPGEETTPPQERATAAQLGAVEIPPAQKVFPKDIGFEEPGREMVVRPITESEATSAEELSKFLVKGARTGGSDLPVSSTKRLTALFDTFDGTVHLVSTYKGDDVVRMVDPEISGKERNSRPVDELLHRYRPFASILLSEPRQGFHQKFMSMADYEEAFGNEMADLVRQHGTGTEGIPKTSMGPLPEVEAEYPVEPGRELSEGFQYPQEQEPNLPRPTEQELRSFHDFFGDTPPSDATMFSRKIEREAAKASRSMINGIRKLVDIERAQNRGLGEAEAIGRVLDKLYENYTSSETRSDFIERTLGQSSYGAPKEIPPRGAAPETGARELSTLRSRGPTEVAGAVPAQTPSLESFRVTPEGRAIPPGVEGPEMLRKVEDTTKKLKDYLRVTGEKVKTAGNLSDQLYRLKTSEKADYDLALPVIKSALKIIPEGDRAKLLQYADEMQVLKKSDIQLTDAQQTIYETFLKPLMDDNQKMYRSLMRAGIPVGESTYLGRMVQDTHSLYNRLWRGTKQRITEGSLLGQGASFFKRRVFKALEAPDGTRRLIALVGDGKDTRVIGYEKGKAELLGKMPPESLEPKPLSPQQIRTQRIVEARRLQELDKLDKEEQALLKEKDRLSKDPNADPVQVKGIDDRLASINGDYAEVGEKYPSPVFDVPRMWKDKNGNTWKFTDATINEIEQNTNTRYYQEPMSGIITQNLKLKQIYRANQFLEDLKNSPDFKRISRSVNERNVPADWRTVDLPQFRGLRIEPRTADVLDLFSQESRGPSLPMQYVTKLTNFLRNSLFVWNPFVHEPNLLMHWFTARGIEWGKPMGYDRMVRSGVAALNDVMTRSRFRDQALRAGAPLMRGMSKINEQVLRLLQKELDPNPTLFTRIARGLGYINPLRMIRAFGDSLTWGTNEVLTLQLIRETMERTGLPLEEAISEVGKHMPNYRIPPRVLNSRLIAHVMRNPLLTLWGHYRYGALRSYGEMGKEILSPKSTAGQRLEGLGRVATIGFLMALAYPAIDDIVNKILKTKGLKTRRAGSTTFPQGVMEVAQGKKTPEALVQSVLTPSPVTQGAFELAFNRNLRTGLPVYERRLGADTLKDLGSFAASKVSPVEEAGRVFGGKKSAQEFGLGLAGITRTRADSAISRFGRMADNWMRTNPDEDIREQYKRRTQDVFQESDYQLLRSAIIREDNRAAQMAVNKLLKTRKPEEVARRIKQWQDSPFTGTRKTDRQLMSEMTPQDWDLWYQAAQERLDIADGMRNALVDALVKAQ